MTGSTLSRVTHRVVRALAMPVAVFVLALGLVVAGPGRQAAEAYTVPPVPIAVGTTTGGPLGGGGMAACAASGICLGGVAVVLLAAGLWMTADSWMPVVQGFLGGLAEKLGLGSGGGASVHAKVSRWEGLERAVKIEVNWTGCNLVGACTMFGQGSSSYWQCQSTTTGVVTEGSTGTDGGVGWFREGLTSDPHVSMGSAAGGEWWTKTPCGAGTKVIFFRVTPGQSFNGYTSVLRGQDISWGQAVPDDQVSQTSTVECQKPDGTVGTITRSQVGHGEELLVPSCQAEWEGSWPRSFDATAGWPGDEKPVVHYDVGNFNEQYPECFGPTGAYLNTCRVRVWINGQPCAIGMPLCLNWQSAEQDNPGTEVECKWGPYVVAMGNCALLKNSYRPDTKTETVTEVDPTTGDPVVGVPPVTWTDLIPCLINCAEPPIPPECGAESCDPSTPPSSSDCMKGAVSFNPVKWVYVPVKCALKWAFVPSSSALTSFTTDIRASWNNSTLGQWSTAVGAAMPNLSESGCAGPTISVDIKSVHEDIQPFNACSGIGATLAGVAKAVVSAGLVWYGSFAAIRILGAGLGWNSSLGRGGGNA